VSKGKDREIGPRCEVGAVGDTYADLEMQARTHAALFFNVSEADLLLVSSTMARPAPLPKYYHVWAVGQWEGKFVYGLRAPSGGDDV
jgi:hypothetical protein